MSGAFGDRLAAAIEPGDVVTIERPIDGIGLHVSFARKVDGYDKPLRGRMQADASPSPDALAKAIETTSGKITEYLAMRDEVQPE